MRALKLQQTQDMEIVLFQPQIPQNTGNILRTCSVTGAHLTLIHPLGFSVNDKTLKRAGLDYWQEVPLLFSEDLDDYLQKNASRPFYFFSSKGSKNYTQVQYDPYSLLIFGSETTGLPSSFHQKYPERFLTIPMKTEARCLNLSNAVAIALYESLRQHNFSFAQ